MRELKNAIVLVMVALTSAIGLAQNAGTAPNQGAGDAALAATPQNVLRVLAPKPDDKIRQDFVTVQYDLTNSAASAAGMPNFQLRLDSRDPVTTNAREYTFTGLDPGKHTVEIQLVDANNTPVAGAHAVLHFTTVAAAPAGVPVTRENIPHARLTAAALKILGDDQVQNPGDSQDLPSAGGGALPLLSVIGFGVLLGGIASAMKTR